MSRIFGINELWHPGGNGSRGADTNALNTTPLSGHHNDFFKPNIARSRDEYNFQITKAEFTASAQECGQTSMDLTISNVGVAQMSYDWDVAFALLNSSGTTVAGDYRVAVRII